MEEVLSSQEQGILMAIIVAVTLLAAIVIALCVLVVVRQRRDKKLAANPSLGLKRSGRSAISSAPLEPAKNALSATQTGKNAVIRAKARDELANPHTHSSQ